MKTASLFLLPLLASGAVIRSPAEDYPVDTPIRSVKREKPLSNLATPSILKGNLAYQGTAKRQIWEAVGNAIAPSLPTLLQWGANNISWIVGWQSMPVKRDRMAPTVDPSAKKILLRYGPYTLRGTTVCAVQDSWATEMLTYRVGTGRPDSHEHGSKGYHSHADTERTTG
jgi:hypothetical protein